MYNHKSNIYNIFLIMLFSCLGEVQIVNSNDMMLTKKKGVLYYDNKSPSLVGIFSILYFLKKALDLLSFD